MVGWILLPPGSVILLLLLAALVARWRGGLTRVLVVAGGLLLYLSSIPVVAAALIGALQIYGPASTAEIDAFQGQAIVMLAAGRRSTAPEFGGETVDSLTLERIRYGARLHRQTGLPVYVAGGDPTTDGTPLAELMRIALADDYGIAVVGLETTSDTTAENAEYMAPVLRAHGISRILLVTHSWHMRRAKRAFEREELVVLPAPTAFIGDGEMPSPGDFLPTASALSGTAYALHEILGYVWYELRYGAPG
jgi:uncharacterized SAM-binding protein YcdF (DUF218 family)